MDSTKLDKEYNKTLPLWVRIGNFISNALNYLDLVEGILILVATFLLGILLAPFTFCYAVISYVFRKK